MERDAKHSACLGAEEILWAKYKARGAELTSLHAKLADRHAERVREIDAHAERVAGLEAQLAQYRWRRVEDELPEDGVLTLIMAPSVPIRIGLYDEDERAWWVSAGLCQPTRWMPLPPAPEEGE